MQAAASSFRIERHLWQHMFNKNTDICEVGGIGRRTSLRGWRSKERVSSSLSYRICFFHQR